MRKGEADGVLYDNSGGFSYENSTDAHYDKSVIEMAGCNNVESCYLCPMLNFNQKVSEDTSQIDMLVRWMSYRKACRKFSLSREGSTSILHQLTCIAFFSAVTFLLLFVTLTHPTKYLLQYTRISVIGTESKRKKFASFLSLLNISHLTLILIGHIITINASHRSELFIKISNYVARNMLLFMPLLVLAQVLIINPTCWIASFNSRLAWLCVINHSILWNYVIRSYCLFQILFGSLFCFADSLINLMSILFYSFAPLFLITGVYTQCDTFIIISTTEDLLKLFKSINEKDYLDQTVVHYCHQQLSEAEKPSKLKIAFIGLRLQGLRQRLMLTVFGSCYPVLRRTYDVVYFGQINKNFAPHGVGHWTDMRSGGERVLGYWENGYPCAPFQTHIHDEASGFASSAVLFSYLSRGLFTFGIVEVEVCLTGQHYKNFPRITRQRENPKLAGETQIANFSLIQFTKLRPETARDYHEGIGLSWCLNQLKKTEDYYNLFSSYNSKVRRQDLNSCILIIPPRSWSFSQSVVGAGSIATFFGHSSKRLITCFCNKPMNRFAFLKKYMSEYAQKPSLSRFLNEFARVGIKFVDIICIGTSCQDLIEAIQSLPVNVSSVCLLLPQFTSDIKDVVKILLQKAGKFVTIYTVFRQVYYNCQLSVLANTAQALHEYVVGSSQVEDVLLENNKYPNIDLVDIEDLLLESATYKSLFRLNKMEKIEFELIQLEDFIHDLRRVILEELSAQHRAPKLRQSMQGIWTFQHTANVYS